MRQLIKRHIGQILLDGRFLSKSELDHALEAQKHTKVLLGQVLVRMGVLRERDFKVPLIVQEHLCYIDDAVKAAAGERQLLGLLLVRSGHITNKQLDHAIAEQKSCREKLGEVFIRLGMLAEKQLTALLDFQKNQSDTTVGPLRFGELLIATGHISRMQLDDALRKQALSHKKLGEVLVDEGYVRPSLVKYGICMQKMLVNSVLAGILSLAMGAAAFASSVVLQWDSTTNSSVSGYRVYSSPDTSALESATPLDVQKQTTVTVSGLDPGKARNVSQSATSTVTVVNDVTPPTVALTAPINNATVSGVVTISSNASDNVGVSFVEFYANGVLVYASNVSPYSINWDTQVVPNGDYAIIAKAYDNAGNRIQSSSVAVKVNNHVSGITAPTDAVSG